MIFVDSNVPMYLIGRDHPNKDAALRVLGELVRAGETLVTDVEVFQEILHRYVALRRREFIRPAFRVLNELADAVLGIERHHVDRAADIVEEMDPDDPQRDRLASLREAAWRMASRIRQLTEIREYRPREVGVGPRVIDLPH